MSSDQSASIIESVRAQLQQDLNRLIENHNKEMKSEMERMEIERENLTTQFQTELDNLRSKHQEEILKAEETQKKKLESIKEVLKLEMNALSNINYNDQNANIDEASTNNDNNNVEFDEKEDLNSSDPIDQNIIKKFEELDVIDQQMSELPESSRDPQDYQKLLLINKKQYKLLRDIASFMKNKVIANTQELNKQLVSIKSAYDNQFNQYEWFNNKQKVLQEKRNLEQKSSV